MRISYWSSDVCSSDLLLVELDQAESVAERIGEHRLSAIGQVQCLALLHRAGGTGARDRIAQVGDGKIGMHRGPVPVVMAKVAAAGTGRRPRGLEDQIDGHLAPGQLDDVVVEPPELGRS